MTNPSESLSRLQIWATIAATKVEIENLETALSETKDKLKNMTLLEPIRRLNTLMGYEKSYWGGGWSEKGHGSVKVENMHHRGVQIAETVMEIGDKQDNFLRETISDIETTMRHLYDIRRTLAEAFSHESHTMFKPIDGRTLRYCRFISDSDFPHEPLRNSDLAEFEEEEPRPRSVMD